MDIYDLSYDDLAKLYIDSYESQFGRQKLGKIHEKIMNSNKLSKMIKRTNENNEIPTGFYILSLLHEIPYFIFADGETVLAGALFALLRWKEEIKIVVPESTVGYILQEIFAESQKLIKS